MDIRLRAKQLYAEGRYQEALALASEALDDNFNDPQALFVLGGIFIQTEKKGLAHNIMARCLKYAPEVPEVWINYARTCTDDPEGWAEAEYCLRKALELKPDSRVAWSNLAALEVQRCRPELGVTYADKALALDPTDKVARSCHGFAHLMLGNWEQGFSDYHAMMGLRSRPDISYPDDDFGEWDGSPGKTVIVHGEQGIGDELIYASFIPDMARDCKYVIYDCMPRLAPLMTRSLPDNVYVAGQRWATDIELPEHIKPDAYITQAGVGMYYRKKDADFPGTPYLEADHRMRLSMRAMLDSLSEKPKIGIAWTGGNKNSRCHFRQRTLEELTPLLRNDQVTWVSLQYKDFSQEIAEYKSKRKIDIHHFPWVTELVEYDHTAAMVAELDLIISVPTSVTQLAGAMGKQTWVMVPEITGWLFSHEPYVWAKSVEIFRNRPVKEIADRLNGWLNIRRAA